MEKLPKFGVIGLGSVGWAVVHGLHQYYNYSCYDIIGNYQWEPILDTDIVFICVGTPMDNIGRLDCNNVDNVLERLQNDSYKGIVIIKSTVSIGFFEASLDRYPSLKLVYMPEFLRERNCYSWFIEPDRIVIAGDMGIVENVLGYFYWIKNCEIIKTDFRSAEIGKLAHNSYIATKVSFTNDMEKICTSYNGNAYDVMKIIWTDRRVKCQEHLTPGLGPFGGKCVLKDMNELVESTHSEFLSAVKKVNLECEMVETIYGYDPVIVIIPTNNRPKKLYRALNSVKNQIYLPQAVIIVSDPGMDKEEETLQVIDIFTGQLNIYHKLNDRTLNLSGAINSGLYHLSKININPKKTFIAFLDDDDWWDRKYLENCIKFSSEYDCDWVIPGIIRYDPDHPLGYQQNIPRRIEIADFIVKNPNIQGSNLFIRAEKILSVNGFDENLYSTTDRDICIRLLWNNDIRYASLLNHLVHHDASNDPDRLSAKDSVKKSQGLNRFYHKYADIMSDDQKLEFKHRAMNLFNVNVDKASL